MGCAKLFLIAFNIIFFLLGGTCLGVGIWILIDESELLRLTAMVEQIDGETIVGLLKGAAIGLIAGGGFVFIIGFLGCFGALKEVKCLLQIYAFIVLLILTGEIVAGVLGYIYRNDVETQLQIYMQKTIDLKYENNFDLNTGSITTVEIFSLAWDYVHWKFQCCGVNGSDNFNTAANWNRTFQIPGTSFVTNLTAPLTCCKTQGGSLPTSINDFVNATLCVFNQTDQAYSNTASGCYTEMKNMVLQYSTVIIGVGVGIAVVEIIGIIAACCLIKDINKKDNKDGKK